MNATKITASNNITIDVPSDGGKHIFKVVSGSKFINIASNGGSVRVVNGEFIKPDTARYLDDFERPEL